MPEAKLSSTTPQAQTGTDVYAIHGAEPEVQAYAMAKYSRSSLSMRESLQEINGQKAEKFLNTFYFQYGHRSIADLAHVAFAVEKLSLLAAIILEDEQRWDGQERSTRYQDFSHPDYYTPDFGNDALADQYRHTIAFLFGEYRALSDAMFNRLSERTPKPAEMKQDQYERTMRARAFDIARYLLPLATNTSLGQIVNARTLETQISRLLSHPQSEIRRLGKKLRDAAKSPAYDVNHAAWRKLVDRIVALDENLGNEAANAFLKEVRPSPTLVKYAEPNAYAISASAELASAASEIMGDVEIDPAPLVDLLDDEPIEIEIATTLLYEHSHHPYRQVRRRIEGLSASERQNIVELGTKDRGRHDELLRAFCAGQRIRFDILMDIGGFRDMHRHRRCTQLHQGFTFAHGFDTPDDVAESEFADRYAAAMQRASAAAQQITVPQSERGGQALDALYLMPLAYRKRTLFKMDFAEAVYISELRTTPAGHFSYRRVAWEMYRVIAERHPELASLFRVHDPNEPVDLLQR